jgi:hypothetical protein
VEVFAPTTSSDSQHRRTSGGEPAARCRPGIDGGTGPGVQCAPQTRADLGDNPPEGFVRFDMVRNTENPDEVSVIECVAER